MTAGNVFMSVAGGIEVLLFILLVLDRRIRNREAAARATRLAPVISQMLDNEARMHEAAAELHEKICAEERKARLLAPKDPA